jgi:hypothetical protein
MRGGAALARPITQVSKARAELFRINMIISLRNKDLRDLEGLVSEGTPSAMDGFGIAQGMQRHGAAGRRFDQPA